MVHQPLGKALWDKVVGTLRAWYVTRQGDGHAHVQAGGGPRYVGGQLHQAYLKTEGDPVSVNGVIPGHHNGQIG